MERLLFCAVVLLVAALGFAAGRIDVVAGVADSTLISHRVTDRR
jgi:hypothetical protein